MAHTYSAIFLHIVFSTTERRDLIPPDRADELHAYIGGIARNLGFRLLCAGGTQNHLHVLISIPAKLAITTAIQKIKANSSRFLGKNFAWQDGYAVFTVSASQIETVKHYIAHQVDHHKKHSFDEELNSLLARYGLSPEAPHAVP